MAETQIQKNHTISQGKFSTAQLFNGEIGCV